MVECYPLFFFVGVQAVYILTTIFYIYTLPNAGILDVEGTLHPFGAVV